MEQKTKIHAENGKQDLVITREFDLPLNLLFKAYAEPELVEQWMGNKVLKQESQKHGSYEYEVKSPQGDILFKANGCFHEFDTNKRIVRTFEMENAHFDVQLEFLEFEELTATTSRLTMHVIYKSVQHRDKQLQLPFAYGINMAHNRLEEVVNQLN